MQRFVTVGDAYRLWAEDHGSPGAPTILLIMGANASGVAWPDPFVARLAARHHVIRYDHRDTGRSTRAFSTRPYPLTDLASDAVAVLDAFGVASAHVVGMSLGGTLTQLLLLDHADRLLSATVIGAAALSAGRADPAGYDALPGPAPDLLAMWAEMGDARGPDEEMDWRIRHWRLLNGGVLPFDAGEFRDLEDRVAAHAGTSSTGFAHAQASQDGLERGAELADVTTPTLVVEAPEDPTAPPPHADYLTGAIGSASKVVVPGMGHALSSAVVEPLAAAVLRHVATAPSPR